MGPQRSRSSSPATSSSSSSSDTSDSTTTSSSSSTTPSSAGEEPQALLPSSLSLPLPCVTQALPRAEERNVADGAAECTTGAACASGDSPNDAEARDKDEDPLEAIRADAAIAALGDEIEAIIAETATSLEEMKQTAAQQRQEGKAHRPEGAGASAPGTAAAIAANAGFVRNFECLAMQVRRALLWYRLFLEDPSLPWVPTSIGRSATITRRYVPHIAPERTVVAQIVCAAAIVHGDAEAELPADGAWAAEVLDAVSSKIRPKAAPPDECPLTDRIAELVTLARGVGDVSISREDRQRAKRWREAQEERLVPVPADAAAAPERSAPKAAPLPTPLLPTPPLPAAAAPAQRGTTRDLAFYATERHTVEVTGFHMKDVQYLLKSRRWKNETNDEARAYFRVWAEAMRQGCDAASLVDVPADRVFAKSLPQGFFPGPVKAPWCTNAPLVQPTEVKKDLPTEWNVTRCALVPMRVIVSGVERHAIVATDLRGRVLDVSREAATADAALDLFFRENVPRSPHLFGEETTPAVVAAAQLADKHPRIMAPAESATPEQNELLHHLLAPAIALVRRVEADWPGVCRPPPGVDAARRDANTKNLLYALSVGADHAIGARGGNPPGRDQRAPGERKGGELGSKRGGKRARAMRL